MIEPKFEGFMVAIEFEKIISVMDKVNGKYETYYLNKSGEKFGTDSVHFFDNTPDCESEGFIRFKDKKTDLVGMFNQNGEITVPAEYNALSRVQNGMVWALKYAEKKYWDKHNESGCNHFSWTDGQELLLSIDNKILIDDFKYEGQIDFFSLEISEKAADKPNKISFKGINNKYYTFTDLEKDFNLWLKSYLLSEPTKIKFIENSMDTITYWQNGWITLSKTEFIDLNFDVVLSILKTTVDSNSDYFVTVDGLNPFMYTSSTYYQYFNTCGEAKREKYPVMDMIVNHKSSSDLIQDHFDFLKTDTGYQLINVTIRSEKIK